MNKTSKAITIAPRILCLLAVGLTSTMICGCGSVVKSTRETSLPDASKPLRAIRYYLPRGKVQVSTAWNLNIPGWEPKITPVIDGDPTACYELHRKLNILFDDNITLTVDPETGLLQSAEATSTDESMAAIGNLAAGASAAMTFGANLLGGPASAGSRGASSGQPAFSDPQIEAEYEETTNNALTSSFSVYVDPHHHSQICYLVEPSQEKNTGNPPGKSVEAVEPAAKLYARYQIMIEKTLKSTGEDEAGSSGPAASITNFDGVVVRVPVPYQVTVSSKLFRGGTHPEVQTNQDAVQVVYLPDDSQEYFMPLDRIPFVTSSTKLTLRDGMVQSLQVNRPSMVNAIAGIPKSILSAIAPLPLQVKQENNQTAGSSTSGTHGSGSGHSSASGKEE